MRLSVRLVSNYQAVADIYFMRLAGYYMSKSFHREFFLLLYLHYCAMPGS